MASVPGQYAPFEGWTAQQYKTQPQLDIRDDKQKFTADKLPDPARLTAARGTTWPAVQIPSDQIVA